MQLLGRWLFQLWLMLLGFMLFVRAIMLAAVERLFGWSRSPFGERVGDRLLHRDAVVLPALFTLWDDDLRTPEEIDGAGWTPEQVPKLWHTCRSLAQKMGVPPPDAIHLSVEPGTCMAWVSRPGAGAARGHIALSLLDLRLLSHDEARAVIAHEIAHVGFRHIEQSFAQMKLSLLMDATADGLPLLLALPVHVSRALYSRGIEDAARDQEREADLKAAQAVGGNHTASALRRICLQAPVLARVFDTVLDRARTGHRAPARLAEAAMTVYRSYEFPRLRRKVIARVDVPGEEHPAVSERVASTAREPSLNGIGGNTAFMDAFPELLAAEELLTRTYFPDTPQHARSDASQLRRKALAARLKRL
jgi:Zn-dependent protease with chaperone function